MGPHVGRNPPCQLPAKGRSHIQFFAERRIHPHREKHTGETRLFSHARDKNTRHVSRQKQRHAGTRMDGLNTERRPKHGEKAGPETHTTHKHGYTRRDGGTCSLTFFHHIFRESCVLDFLNLDACVCTAVAAALRGQGVMKHADEP